ncbi:hypothetical protein ASPWEDRAFT_41359 [Aspergillus wentii DTO 134E9]|uniref:Uncharacterized protein n=1 Tax=Aspergillus wentii DTO 134E9 TaxID=1073089 RepID=A0A1L9RML2_ASPWE|nr:uncharacterized protein ASPWEDRAFT_41359 [Aspergillus wentii DTO 134E9]OJJ36123.1 hypothetical protein ASPWEDRAFT_41359 [Aspergillus wentii DTO 134E9]
MQENHSAVSTVLHSRTRVSGFIFRQSGCRSRQSRTWSVAIALNTLFELYINSGYDLISNTLSLHISYIDT